MCFTPLTTIIITLHYVTLLCCRTIKPAAADLYVTSNSSNVKQITRSAYNNNVIALSHRTTMLLLLLLLFLLLVRVHHVPMSTTLTFRALVIGIRNNNNYCRKTSSYIKHTRVAWGRHGIKKKKAEKKRYVILFSSPSEQ